MAMNEISPSVHHVELIDPIPEMGLAYRKFLQEFIEEGEEGLLLHLPDENEAPGVCIRRLQDHAAGLNLPEGRVPSSTYWLLSDDEVLIGEVHIRHRLTQELEDYGGHIGYMVRPGERKKGYGTMMLAMALEKSLALGFKRVMVTCEPGNTASARIICKNGGKLISESATRTGRMISRYWFDL